MLGHVSGLPSTRAGPSARAASRRFTHDLLTEERNGFVGKLEEVRRRVQASSNGVVCCQLTKSTSFVVVGPNGAGAS